MKMKKTNNKVALIVSFVCIIFAVALCILWFRSSLFNPGRIYYNDNLLMKENERYHATNSTMAPEGDFSLGRFSGIQTIEVINLNEGESLSATWNVNVTGGKFKIVLVDMGNAKIVQTIEGTDSGSAKLQDLPASEYRVKFVGDKAVVNGAFNITN